MAWLAAKGLRLHYRRPQSFKKVGMDTLLTSRALPSRFSCSRSSS